MSIDKLPLEKQFHIQRTITQMEKCSPEQLLELVKTMVVYYEVRDHMMKEMLRKQWNL